MFRRPALIYGAACALLVVPLLVSYVTFRWVLIRFQTWHLGHPNPFVIEPEMDATLLFLLAGAIVFGLVVSRRRRH